MRIATWNVNSLKARHEAVDKWLERAEPDILLKTMGEAAVAHNNAKMLPTAGPRLTHIEQRLADMDAMGVDVQLISPSPTQW